MPGLGSDRVYIVDVKTDPLNPKLDKVIEPWDLHKHGVSTPHTTHCLADGNVMISTLGDGPEKNGKGSFLLLDGETFKPVGNICGLRGPDFMDYFLLDMTSGTSLTIM